MGVRVRERAGGDGKGEQGEGEEADGGRVRVRVWRGKPTVTETAKLMRQGERVKLTCVMVKGAE